MNESTPPEDKRRPGVTPPTDEGASSDKDVVEHATAPDEPNTAKPGDTRGEDPPSEPTSSTAVEQIDETGEPEEPVVETDRAREEAVVAAPAGARSGRGLAALALFVALAAAAGSGYVAWMTKLAVGQADTAKADLSGDLGRLEAKSVALEESLRTVEREQRSGSEQVGRLSGIESRLEGRIDALENRTAALARTEGVPRDEDWRLAEVEFLLRLANRQLGLARDPVGAQAALENADHLLAELADPAMQPVRQQLADDILSLRSLQQPDVEGLALRLGSLARRVATLPLASQPIDGGEAASAGEADSGWQRLKVKIREFFASIFQVRRAAGSAAPLLSPEEAFFLKRNLELELQAARVALLMGNGPVYRASIGSARRWAEEHFLANDPGVHAFIDALGELEGRDISVDLPDVSGSLQIFSEVRSEEGS
jgi:uroporphyrin-3 C-methyltransferase